MGLCRLLVRSLIFCHTFTGGGEVHNLAKGAGAGPSIPGIAVCWVSLSGVGVSGAAAPGDSGTVGSVCSEIGRAHV